MIKKRPPLYVCKVVKQITCSLLFIVLFSFESFAQLSTESITYYEDFNSTGIPTDIPNNSYWTFHNEIHPSQDTWEQFIPGDGYAYLTVDPDTSNDTDWIHPYQTLEFGGVGENHRLEVRMKGAVVDGGLVAFLFTYEQEGSIFNEVDIEVVANDSATPDHEVLGENGGWTDARFNTWGNANEISEKPFTGTKKPVVNAANESISLIDDEFHIYTIDWREDRIDFFIDGVLQETITTSIATGVSEVIIGFRQLPWAGDFNWTGTHTMVVDYLKIEPIEVETFAANDFISTLYNKDNILDVLANDTANSTIISFDTTTTEGNTVTGNANELTFTPLNNFVGQDSFTYTMEDTEGVQITATVFITAKPRPLDAVDDAVVINTGSSTILIDVIANDAFGENGESATHPLTLRNGRSSSASDEGGDISVVNGQVSYSVPDGFTGIDSFDYTITDRYGYAETAIVTITVGDDVPTVAVAADDSYIVNEATATDLDVLDNDSSGTTIISYDAVSTAGNSVSATGSLLTYTPSEGFTGADSFTYTIEDGNGTQATAAVAITVEEEGEEVIVVSGEITAVDDVILVATGSTNILLDVTNNDSYGENGENATHPLTLRNGRSSSASDEGGDISVVNGQVRYSAPDGFTGTDSFDYTITDGRGYADKAYVTITVGDDVPAVVVATDDSYTIDENTATDFDVLTNDSSGTTIVSYDALSTAGNSVSATGSLLRYTPSTGFTGTDSFTYTIEDGNGTQATAVVTITVEEEEVVVIIEEVTALDDSYTIEENTATDFDVLTNDSSGTSIVSYDTLSTAGNSVSATGSLLRYTPLTGFTGTDSFTYTIEDEHGTQATATVAIIVEEIVVVVVSGEITAVDDAILVAAGSTNILLDVTNNDSYGENGESATHPLTLRNGRSSSASDEGGDISVVNGQVRYSAPDGFTGTDSFDYTITDGRGYADKAYVTITVGDDVPTVVVATDDSFTIDEGVTTSLDVLSNDSSGIGTTIVSYDAVSTAGNSVSSTGSLLTYTPSAGFVGTDSFTYTIEDNTGAQATAVVTITVEEVVIVVGEINAVDDTISVVAGSTNILLDVTHNDSFGENGENATHPLTLRNGRSSSASDEGGAISVVNGQVSYSIPNGFTGTDSFDYTITDGRGYADKAYVTIVVLAAEATTTAVANSVTIDVGTTAGFSGVSELENKILSYTNPSSGYVKVRLTSTIHIKTPLVIYDVTGKVIYRTSLDIKSGTNEFELNVNTEPGIKFMKILSSEVNFGITKILFK